MTGPEMAGPELEQTDRVVTVGELTEWLARYDPKEEVVLWGAYHVSDPDVPGQGWRHQVELPVLVLSDDPDNGPWMDLDLYEFADSR